MRVIFTIFIVLVSANSLFCQSARILELEAQLKTAKGADYFQKSLNLSEWYLEEGFPERALDFAFKAEDAANKMSNNTFAAIALNRQGKALVQYTKNKTQNQNRAALLFRKSVKKLEGSNEKALKLDNLESLKKLAEGKDRARIVAGIDKEIAALNNNASNSNTIIKGDIGNPREDDNSSSENPLMSTDARNDDLNSRLNSLDQEKKKLLLQSQQLNQMVNLQKKEISNMTEEQAKSQLVLAMQKNMMDSLAYNSLLDSAVLAQHRAELFHKDLEIKQKGMQRNLFLAIAALGLLGVAAIFLRYRSIQSHNKVLEEKNQIIATEKQRSEELLLNILPVSIADELKENGVAAARYYEQATVLFTDFKDFTNIAEKLSPKDLVADLDYCYKEFDRIIGRFGLEKIKTIGDAYMCAGGIPTPEEDHPARVIQAAKEIQAFLKDWKMRCQKEGKPFFEARIGIHTGPLIAGVVGEKKFAYDVWGDTVVIAARMEQSGESGRINISAATHALVKEGFKFDYRGKVTAKGKGELDMYFVA